MGFNTGHRFQQELPARMRDPRKTHNDEEWYIPYTGPYEEPPESRYSTNKDRDSWGDPISDLANGEGFEDHNLHVHYDGSRDQHGLRSSEESRGRDRGRGRDRSQSLASTFTTSTGIEQNRTSYITYRPSNASSFARPPIHSYVTPDSAGGVGESPAPLPRNAKDRHLSRRGSLASLFNTFGIKSPLSPHKRSVKPSTGGHGADRSNKVSPHTRTLSGELHNRSIHGRRGIKEPLQSLNSQSTDEDYYNSYYSTLIQSPVSPHHNHNIFNSPRRDSVTSPTTKTNKHPYALAFPKSEDIAEPTMSTLETTVPVTAIPKLTFTGARDPSLDSDNAPQTSSQRLQPSKVQQQVRGLSSYSSTPNFMIHFTANKSPLSSPRKAKDKWFSAETWCDALLFPRPRLKLRDGESSSRNISPLGSPIMSQDVAGQEKSKSFASRVLAHSRSLVDLRESKTTEESRLQQSDVGISLATPQKGKGKAKEVESPNAHLRPSRPKSWALDDLDLPSPVPSLAKVLEDAERLAHERKEWKSKAFNSIGNKQARNVSRARSKSLTAKGRKTSTQPQSNIDFLTARACLGNQEVISILPSTKYPKSSSRQETISKSSHTCDTSHTQTHTSTTSVIRTLTRSSKSHSRQHSRNDSWSKSAFKTVKTTAAACLQNDNTVTPVEEKQPPHLVNYGLEDALQRTDTRVIQLDPLNLPSDFLSPLSPIAISASRSHIGISPSPSGESSVLSDSRIGIALSTPPLEHTSGREFNFVSSHPYAQGGLYTYNEPPSKPMENPEHMYAGPHPSSPAYITSRMAESESPIGRHKFPPPPVTTTLHHPYAQIQVTSDTDSYDERVLIKQPRPDSDIPPHSKMWAPIKPGVVREILPTDLQYSPYIDGDGTIQRNIGLGLGGGTLGSGLGKSEVGIGEVLAYATEYTRRHRRQSPDSGIGTSENIHGSTGGDENDEVENEEDEGAEEANKLAARYTTQSSRRTPVKYDVTRPLLQKALISSETAHTYASSPLEHHLTPKFPFSGGRFINNSGSASGSGLGSSSRSGSARPSARASPIIGSEGSSQRNSPKPLGSPNDLVGFQDLFYKPSSNGQDNIRLTLNRMEAESRETHGGMSGNGSQSKLSNIPYDLKSSPSPYSTPTSGLTNLARKLSEEYDVHREKERERSGSQYSFQSTVTSGVGSGTGSGTGVVMGSMSRLPKSFLGRRPTEESLEFVFEEMQQRRTSSPELMDNRVIDSFHPAENIPEDVASASSIDNHGTMEDDENETAVLQMKQVGVATPTAIVSDKRTSFMGQVYEGIGRHHYSGSGSGSRSIPNAINNGNLDTQPAKDQYISIISSPPSPTSPTSSTSPTSPISSNARSRSRILSGLQAPLSELDIGRSSYITSSTFSRMSTLSDFPVPPKDYIANHRMSLLSAYFDERMRRRGDGDGGIGEGDGDGDGDRDEFLGMSSPDMSSMRMQIERGEEEEKENQILSSSPAHSFNLSVVNKFNREEELDVDEEDDNREEEDNEDTFRQRLNHDRRLTFGEGADAEDLVQALSDHGHGHAI